MDESKDFVEALEEGKIVKVSRDYATREGLLVLKNYDKPNAFVKEERSPLYTRYKAESKGYVDLDKYRKPLKSNDSITSTLVENFGWIVISKRKEKNITRKQLANSIGVIEEDIKVIELGSLPRSDYVLINKIEDYFGILLRKDPSAGRINLLPKQNKESRFLKTQKGRVIESDKITNKNMVSDDIEIIDEVD